MATKRSTASVALRVLRREWPAQMDEFVATRLSRAVPELSLCKEEFDVQTLLYARLGITQQACNCLSASVPMVAPDGRRHLPLIGVRP